MSKGYREDKLRDMIVAAIALADDGRHYLVGALLSQALDALGRDGRPPTD